MGNPTPLPYADLVGSEDPLALLAKTPARTAELVRTWDNRRWSLSYAPGKWTGAQVILHLAQDEICWGNRVRLALSVPGYVVQPFDGDLWVAFETPTDPGMSLAAYVAVSHLNHSLYQRITSDQRSRPFLHPERGEISIEWILRVTAGHQIHHLRHLQAIGEA